MFENRVALPGSERTIHPAAKLIATADCSVGPAHVTIVLKRRDLEPNLKHRIHFDDFPAFYGADRDDIDIVERFAHHCGLAIVESDQRKRTVILAGSVEALTAAFGTSVACFQLSDGKTFRGRTGMILIPEELKDAVIAVLGLDNRPIAKPHFRRRKRGDFEGHSMHPQQAVALPAGTFTPQQLAKLYHFPDDVNGIGETIAIIELGGGYNAQDLSIYFQEIGIESEPKITAVSVNGAENSPGGDSDGEVALDIEVCGAIANGANIAVYFAPNTDQGFVNALIQAVHDPQRKPSVVSISWGSPEDHWTQQSRDAMTGALQDAAALGVTVLVASGDDGSTDGAGDGKLHVDFPASSPFALACGGTNLVAAGGVIANESVWNATADGDGAGGGGVSNIFARPPYQETIGVPANPQTAFVGRGVPDVAADADPATGYFVRVDGSDQIIGGTSAVAPLVSALIALINQKLGKPAGFIHPKLYAPPRACQAVTQGNNDDSNLGSYSAHAGWNACCGLGSIDGMALLSVLSK